MSGGKEKSLMRRKILLSVIALSALAVGSLAGCGKTEQKQEVPSQAVTSAAEEMEDSSTAEEITDSSSAEEMDSAVAENSDVIDPVAAEDSTEEITREDGERFKDVFTFQGVEETVKYEHIRNDEIGIEMDYDYESFVRQSDADREIFISVYDDLENPENYLEVTYSSEDADTVAESISEDLAEDYDIEKDTFRLDRAGECIRIDAEIEKGTNNMAEYLQTVYIIPADDGCRIVREHYYIVDSEGFAKRLSYIINTIKIIRTPNLDKGGT